MQLAQRLKNDMAMTIMHSLHSALMHPGFSSISPLPQAYFMAHYMELLYKVGQAASYSISNANIAHQFNSQKSQTPNEQNEQITDPKKYIQLQRALLMSHMHDNYINYSREIQSELLGHALNQFDEKYGSINGNVMLSATINTLLIQLYYTQSMLGESILRGCREYLDSHVQPEGIPIKYYKPFELAGIRSHSHQPPNYPREIIGQDTYLIHNSRKPEQTLSIIEGRELVSGRDKNGCAGQNGICSYSDPDGQRISDIFYDIATNNQKEPFVVFKARADEMEPFKINMFQGGYGGLCRANSVKIDPIMSYTPITGLVIHDVDSFEKLCLPATAIPGLLYTKRLATIATDIFAHGIPFLDDKTGEPLTLQEAADLLHEKPEKFVQCILHSAKNINDNNARHGKDTIDIDHLESYCTKTLEEISKIEKTNTYIATIQQSMMQSSTQEQSRIKRALHDTQKQDKQSINRPSIKTILHERLKQKPTSKDEGRDDKIVSK